MIKTERWRASKVDRQRNKERLAETAKKLFKPVGKKPYIHYGKAIMNFEELRQNLGEFSQHEALWVASWIEYLGDSETAEKIRRAPEKFKDIIMERYLELKYQSF